jgi:hypothetical protein
MFGGWWGCRMAGDGQSGKPAVAPGSVGPGRALIGHRRRVESASRTEHRRPIFAHWRPIMFLGILLVTVGAGLYFKSQANPGSESPMFGNQPPQYINVYESNGEVPITVTVTFSQGFSSPQYARRLLPVTLRQQGLTYFDEEVDVTAMPAGSATPGTIIITSSTRPLAGPDISSPVFFRLKSDPSSGLTDMARAERFAVPVSLAQDGDGTWSGTAFYGSVPIIMQNNGSTFGHLPSIGAYESPYPRTPFLQAVYDRRTGKLENVVSPLFGSTGILRSDNVQSFGAPYDASYAEAIKNIAPALGNEEINYAIPSLDSGSDIDYIWRSNGTSGLAPILDPSFKMTDPNAVDFQSQAAFASGLAFGVAGTAAIALAQELPKELSIPEWWARLRRRREVDAERRFAAEMIDNWRDSAYGILSDMRHNLPALVGECKHLLVPISIRHVRKVGWTKQRQQILFESAMGWELRTWEDDGGFQGTHRKCSDYLLYDGRLLTGSYPTSGFPAVGSLLPDQAFLQMFRQPRQVNADTILLHIQTLYGHARLPKPWLPTRPEYSGHNFTHLSMSEWESLEREILG